MAFNTEIEYQGIDYNLQVEDSYTNPETGYPETIDLDISISKMVAGDSYFCDKLYLTFTEKTRQYTFREYRGNVEPELYQMIIEKLNYTYPEKWGWTAN